MATGSFKLPISSGGGEWVRPADWLPMPTGITSADQTFVGLYAIFPEGQNYAAFTFATSLGQYQVDWGDGTVTLHNNGFPANHEYNYATVDNSTITSRGYKQAIITVTPVSGFFTACNLQVRFVTSPIQNQNYATGFLDCILSMPNANVGNTVIIGSTTVAHRYVERFDIKTIGGCTLLTNLFFGFFSLQSVPLFNTASVTNMTQMFSNCFSLQSVPLFNTASVTNMTGMFSACYSLQSVPLLNTSAVTLMNSMFSSCFKLKTIPLLNTQNVQQMTNMFSSCFSMKTVPLLNTALVTNMQSMFNSCASLISVPLFNTISVTNMSSMFSSCSSLQSVPFFNTANVNNMQQMFFSCPTINYIPTFSTASITTTSGTDYSGFAQGCNSLDRIQMVFARTINIQDCQLSRTALVEIFNNLVDRTATTSATINIFRNWGASALTAGERAIATGKNWLITG